MTKGIVVNTSRPPMEFSRTALLFVQYLSKDRKVKVFSEYFNHRTFFRKSTQDRNGKATENNTLCSPQVQNFYSVETELIEKAKNDLR